MTWAASAPEPWPRSQTVGRPQPSGRRTHPWAIATFDREPDVEFSCAHAAADGAGGVCWVTGEIDLVTADGFRVRAVEALETYGPPLTIDMSGVRFMDSSGLKALVDIRAHARRAGHSRGFGCAGSAKWLGYWRSPVSRRFLRGCEPPPTRGLRVRRRDRAVGGAGPRPCTGCDLSSFNTSPFSTGRSAESRCPKVPHPGAHLLAAVPDASTSRPGRSRPG